MDSISFSLFDERKRWRDGERGGRRGRGEREEEERKGGERERTSEGLDRDLDRDRRRSANLGTLRDQVQYTLLRTLQHHCPPIGSLQAINRHLGGRR